MIYEISEPVIHLLRSSQTNLLPKIKLDTVIYVVLLEKLQANKTYYYTLIIKKTK